MLIGAMHMRSHPSKISRVYTFAAAAKMEGVDFFYFSPGKIDFKYRRIKGKYYKNGDWREKMFPFPDVVINMFSPKTDNQVERYIRLSNEVTYTETCIGNKEKINSLLEKHNYFKKFLPATKKAGSIKNVKKFIDNYKKVVLKPKRGYQGIGIIIIEKDIDKYKVYENGKEKVIDSLYILDDIDLSNYIIQEFIVSETKNGLPVDFRIHTQKNGKGKYILSTIFPRIANVKNKVTNYSQGGYTSEIKSFLKYEYDKDWISIHKLMKVFGIQLSEFINECYDYDLNELGIDVGIDKDCNIYLYEINWRPGPPIVFLGEIEHAKNIIKYCVNVKKKSKYP